MVCPHSDAVQNVLSVNRCFARCTSRQRHENSSGWMAMYGGTGFGELPVNAFDAVGASQTGRRLPGVAARLSHAFFSKRRTPICTLNLCCLNRFQGATRSIAAPVDYIWCATLATTLATAGGCPF